MSKTWDERNLFKGLGKIIEYNYSFIGRISRLKMSQQLILFQRYSTRGITSRSGWNFPFGKLKAIFSQLKKISKVKFIFFSVKNLKIWCFITSKKFQLSPAIVQLRRRFSHFSTSRWGRTFPNGKKKFEQILPVREVFSSSESFFPIGSVAETDREICMIRHRKLSND